MVEVSTSSLPLETSGSVAFSSAATVLQTNPDMNHNISNILLMEKYIPHACAAETLLHINRTFKMGKRLLADIHHQFLAVCRKINQIKLYL